jgi:hypothetical protein
MTTVSIESAVDPGSNPLSAKSLAIDVEGIVAASLVAQAQALVLMRQADAAPFTRNPTLANTLRTHQDRMRRGADYFLNGLMPDVVKSATNADGAATLMAALAPSLAQVEGSDRDRRAAAGQLVAAVDETFVGYLQDATELAEAFNREAAAFEASRQEFAAMLEARIHKLEGPDGAIAKTRGKITTARDAIEADLQAIVSDAQNIGAGIKKIVTGILTTFDMAAKSDGKKPAASDGGDAEGVDLPDDSAPAKPADKADKTAADDKKPAPMTAEQTEEAADKTFPVEGVGAVTAGAEGVESSVTQFRADNAALATLYQHLGRQSALLAICTVVHDQINDYAKMLRAGAAAAAKVEQTWQQVRGGLQSELAAMQEAADPSAVTQTVTTLSRAAMNTSWSRLSQRMQRIRGALTGHAGLVPSVGQLAA